MGVHSLFQVITHILTGLCVCQACVYVRLVCMSVDMYVSATTFVISKDVTLHKDMAGLG